MQRFQERWTLTRFQARGAAAARRCSTCYREAGRREAHPMIAIVDYEDVPTRTEHHMFRDFFEERGYPRYVCDPRDLTYEDGALRSRGPFHRHRVQAAAGERVASSASTSCSRSCRRRASGAVTDGEPVPLQAHPQEGHLRGADRRRAWRGTSTTPSGRPSPPTCPGRGGCARADQAPGPDDRPRALRSREPRPARPQAERRVRRQGRVRSAGRRASPSGTRRSRKPCAAPSSCRRRSSWPARASRSWPRTAACASATWSWTWTRSCSRARSRAS